MVGRGERGRPSVPGPNLFTTEREIPFTPKTMEAPSSRELKKNARSHVPSVSDRFLLNPRMYGSTSQPAATQEAVDMQQHQLSFASHPIPSHQSGYLALLHPAGRCVEGAFLFFYAYMRGDHIRHCGLVTGALADVDLSIKRRPQDLSRRQNKYRISFVMLASQCPESCCSLSPTLKVAESRRSGTFWAACMRDGASACPEYSPHSGPMSKVSRHFSSVATLAHKLWPAL
jgi:hypothetical protein